MVKIEDGQKILFVKLGAIGDVLHTLPSLQALKSRYPRCSVSWLVEKKASCLIEGHPLIDQCFVFDRSFKAAMKIVRNLRQCQFDLAIDFQGTYKSASFARFSAAKQLVGYDQTREPVSWLYKHKVPLKTMDRHAIDRNFDLLEALGVSAQRPAQFPLVDCSRAQDSLQQKLQALNAQRLIVLSASAGKPSNRWPWQKFSQLTDRLTEQEQQAVILIGSAADDPLNQKILSGLKGSRQCVHNWAGKLSLLELACLLDKAQLMIAGDTGPMHLAVARSCPVVAIFAGANPLRTGPYQGNNAVVRQDISCSPCYKKYCPLGHHDCMNLLEVSDVYNSVQSVLERKISQ